MPINARHIPTNAATAASIFSFKAVLILGPHVKDYTNSTTFLSTARLIKVGTLFLAFVLFSAGCFQGDSTRVLVVPRTYSENCGSMVLTNFKALELPQSLHIPANATHRNVGADGEVRPLIMRSTRPSTLHDERRDLVRCARDFDIDLAAPPSERFVIQYYIDEGSLGNLSRSGGKLSAIDNPINKMALGDVAGLVIRDGGISLVDALAAFLNAKRKISVYLRDRLGESVYVSPGLAALDFDHVAMLRRDDSSNVSAYYRSAGIDVHFFYDFICNYLNVIRLPLKHGNYWLLTLIPNILGATDEEMGRQLCLYYKVHSRREQMGVVLTAEDMANIKAITGTETHALLDFLVVKFADQATSQAVGIPPGRARSVVRRYDSLCERLHRVREVATLKVAGAIVISKGRGVLDQKAAVRYEMRRRAEAENFLKSAALATRQGKGMRYDKDLQELVLAITRESNGALSKGKGGLTPSEDTLLGPAMDDYDIPGGKVDRLYAVACQAVASKFGFTLSRSTFYEILRGPCNVQFCMIEHTLHSPVLSQHFCRAFILTCRWLFALFPRDSVVVTFDQKQLIKAGSDGNVTKEFQIMTERAASATVDHGMNNDTLCSLALYAMWLMPAVEIGVAIAAWGADFEGLVAMLESKGVYDRDEFGSERSGVAAALCYIHGGKDISPEICERETAVRNACALDSFYNRYSDHFSDVSGSPAPFMLHICDNSKGAMDRYYCFCLGIDFFTNDRDIIMSVSPAGKCSTDSPGEKVVGALSKRTNGGHIAYDDLDSRGADEAAKTSRQALVDRAHGATFNAGGGHVDVFVAESLPSTFPWDVAEIEMFVAMDNASKGEFVSLHEAECAGISSLYRKVDRYQQGRGDHELFTKGVNMCIWRKLDGCGDVKPWRGQREFAVILDMFGPDRKPPASVPSEERPKSYMRLLERIKSFSRYSDVSWDQYNPRLLMDKVWNAGLKDLYFANGGNLPEKYVEAMMHDFRADKRTILHEVERLAHLEIGSRARAELDRLHKSSGVDAIVNKFVREIKGGRGKPTIPELRFVLTGHFKVKKSQQQSHRADLLHALAKLIPEAARALVAQPTIRNALAAGASAHAAAAALADPAAPAPICAGAALPEMMAVDTNLGAAEPPQAVALSGDDLLLKAQASDSAAAAHEEAVVALADAVGAFDDDDAGSRAARTAAAAATSDAALGRGMRARRPALDSANWVK